MEAARIQDSLEEIAAEAILKYLDIYDKHLQKIK